ncbi:MAG: putative membrane protein YdjX (TVP38/TMEM64 family) [Pseudohongiellaceae bacterium]|jgi:uncharacterized membrane protein YdjX (TVP38/TMEM64 family)
MILESFAPMTVETAVKPEVAEQPGKGKARVVVLLALLLGVVAAFFTWPIGDWIQDWLQQAVAWVEALGPWGPLALVGLYIVACVALAPASVLTLGAGAVFGVVQGTIAVFIGATLGASAAFLVGRYLARDWVASKVAGNPRFSAIDRAVSREGLKIVVLTRLSPVFPFNLLNYAYGLTGVTFRDYFIGSLGMLPGTLMYVYLGSVGAAAAGSAGGTDGAEDAGAAGGLGLEVVGLLATIVVTVFVTRIASRALNEATANSADGES